MVRLKLYIEETEGGEVSVEMEEEDKDDEVGLSVGGGLVAARPKSLPFRRAKSRKLRDKGKKARSRGNTMIGKNGDDRSDGGVEEEGCAVGAAR